MEGSDESPDTRLYSLLFPGVTIRVCGGYDEVERAVGGLLQSPDFAHVQAFGLVDGDGRTVDPVAGGVQTAVYPLSAYAVESLYYCADAIEAVTRHRAEVLGQSADELLGIVKERILEVLKTTTIAQDMAARRSWRRMRKDVILNLPSWETIRDSPVDPFPINAETGYQEELEFYWQLLGQDALDEMVARYPIDKTPAFNQIAGALKYGNRQEYERILLFLVRKDPQLARRLRLRIGPLSRELSAE